LVFQGVSFPQVSPLKPCMHLSSPPYVLHVLPISVFLILITQWYLVRSRTEGSVWFRGLLRYFVIRLVFVRWGVVSTSPNPQAGGPPLVGCPRLLIKSIRSYPPYLEAFLHPQPEDAPCRGDRDPLITVRGTHLSLWQGPIYHSNTRITETKSTRSHYSRFQRKNLTEDVQTHSTVTHADGPSEGLPKTASS
jgi:hypothetical protein